MKELQNTRKNIRTKLNKFMIKQLAVKDIINYLIEGPHRVLLDVRTKEEWTVSSVGRADDS